MLLSSRWNSFLSVLWQITSLFCLSNSFYVWAHFSYSWHIYLANLVVPEYVTHPDRFLLYQHSLSSKHGEFFLIYFSTGLVDWLKPHWWVLKVIWAHLPWVAFIVWSWRLRGGSVSWQWRNEDSYVFKYSSLIWQNTSFHVAGFLYQQNMIP